MFTNYSRAQRDFLAQTQPNGILYENGIIDYLWFALDTVKNGFNVTPIEGQEQAAE
jgi:hypothetical protein